MPGSPGAPPAKAIDLASAALVSAPGMGLVGLAVMALETRRSATVCGLGALAALGFTVFSGARLLSFELRRKPAPRGVLLAYGLSIFTAFGLLAVGAAFG